MSIEKAEVKRLTVQEVARRIEKLRESAEHGEQQSLGAKAAIQDGLRSLASVKVKWSRDLQEEKITPTEHEIAMKALTEAEGGFRNLTLKYDAAKLQHAGGSQMANRVLDVCEKIFAEEGAKAQALLEAIENSEDGQQATAGRPPVRLVGSRPQGNLAAERKAAEQARKAEENGNGVSDDADELIRQAEEMEKAEQEEQATKKTKKKVRRRKS